MSQGEESARTKALDPSAASFSFTASAAAFVPAKPSLASAAPFIPASLRADAEARDDEGLDHDERADQPRKQSFADLGLDSLGFVDTEDGEDDVGGEPASPLTKQRRQEVVTELERGMSGEHTWNPGARRHLAHDDEGEGEYYETYDDAGYHQQQYASYHDPSQYHSHAYDGTYYHGGHADHHGSGGDGGVLDEREFLSFLRESFAGYSLESLEELLAANNGDIALTVDILTDLDVEVEPPEPPSLDDESNFPTLGGPSGGARQSAAAPDPAVEPPEVQFRSFTISGGRSNVSGGAAGGFHGVASALKDESGGNSNFADRVKSIAALEEEDARSRGGVRIGYGAGRFSGRGAAASQPWVETGEAVSNMYASTREEARDHMRLRNVCFQQATQAYLSGNKALAKELSRKGRAHARAMASAHSHAAAAIYEERNASLAAAGGGGGAPRMIDLHGLHRAEAVSILTREFPERRARGETVVHVLVGTGHHTKNTHQPAPLAAVVKEFCHHWGLRFWVPQAGMLEVDLSSMPLGM